MTTHTQFRTEEPPTGFLDWADNLVAERDLARAEAASWEEQCLDARKEVAELRAAAAHTRGARAVQRLTLAERDALPRRTYDDQYDGRGQQ